MSTGVYAFGDCWLEVATHQLTRSGQSISLRRVVFDLIAYLLRIRPRVATHRELAEEVWRRPQVSAGMVAKAVMEARRAIGDDGSEPSLIVSIHGLGYRFAAAVTEGADQVAPAPDDDIAAVVREAVLRTDQAISRSDFALAQLEAEHALMKAESSGINRARVDAMLACARVAKFTGPVERVGRLAAAALKLARAERQVDQLCEAQVELAHVHVMHGSSLQAIELLKSALPVLQEQGPSKLLLLCESRLYAAHADLHQYDIARTWCHRAQATAERIGDHPRVRWHRILESSLLLTQGMAIAEQGEAARANHVYEQALEIISTIQIEPGEPGPPDATLLWLGNRSFALMMNGRLDEAWADAKAFRLELERWPQSDGPYLARWWAIFNGHMALLLGRGHRFTEAFEQLEAGIEKAMALQSLPTLILLHRYAVMISQDAGLCERAFEHLRLQRDAERKLQTEQARTLVTLLQVESEAASMTQELELSRTRIRQLEESLAELRQRLSQLELGGMLDVQGFGTPLMVDGLMTSAHAQAQARDLPFCLLMLVIDNYWDLEMRCSAATLEAVSRAIARHLMATEFVRQPVVRWRASHYLMTLDNLGLIRARALSATLLETLRRIDWQAETLAGSVPQFVCRCVDASRMDSLVEAVRSIE